MMSIRNILFSLTILSAWLLPPTILYPQTKNSEKENSRSLVLKETQPAFEIVRPGYDKTSWQLIDAFNVVRKANAGDPVAQHELGLRYLTGTDFPVDTVKAAMWIQKAAMQNLIPAMYNWGILLNNGWGTAWNPFEAYKQFRFAASSGMKESEYVFGLFLTDHLVVSRNYREAYMWEKRAARAGYEPAKDVIAEFNRRKFIPKETDSTVQSGVRRSAESSRKATSGRSRKERLHEDSTLSDINGNILKQEALDQMAKSSAQNSRDSQKSEPLDSLFIQSLLQAADNGSPEALILLGYWNQEGKFGAPSDVVASSYYIRALRLESPWAAPLLTSLITKERYFESLKVQVAADNPLAEFVWARLVAYNFDHRITQEQASQFLMDASSRKYSPAIVELSMGYYYGNWVKQDRDSALRLLTEAAILGSAEASVRLAMLAIVDSTSAGRDTLAAIFQQAALRGSVLAELMLGYCYQYGVGVPSNKSQAITYYRKASRRGNKAAYDALRAFYNEIRPNDPEFQIADEGVD